MKSLRLGKCLIKTYKKDNFHEKNLKSQFCKEIYERDFKKHDHNNDEKRNSELIFLKHLLVYSFSEGRAIFENHLCRFEIICMHDHVNNIPDNIITHEKKKCEDRV